MSLVASDDPRAERSSAAAVGGVVTSEELPGMAYVSIIGAVICLITAVFSLLAWRAASRQAVGSVDPSVSRGLQTVHTMVEGVAGSLREEHERLRTAQAGELGHLRQEVQAQIAGVQELLLRTTTDSGTRLDAFNERSVERFDQAQGKMSRDQAAALQSLRESVAEQIKQLVDRSDALRVEIAEGTRLAREAQAQQVEILRQELRAEQDRTADASRVAAENLATSQKAALEELRTSLTERVAELVQRNELAKTEQAEALRLAGEQTQRELVGSREELTRTTTVQREELQRQLSEFRGALATSAEVGRTASEAMASSQRAALEELRVALTDRVAELTQRGEEARAQQSTDLKAAAEQTQRELAGFRTELTATTSKQRDELTAQLGEFRSELGRTTQQLREESTRTREKGEQSAAATTEVLASSQRRALADLQETVAQRLTELTSTMTQEQQTARRELQSNLKVLTDSNEQKLEKMRETVAEKLDSTLGERLNSSFQQVTSQLESVHKGLGEMQTLAQGVGSLQRTLTNVKTRGAWAELHLEALLSDVMTPEQYRRQWKVVPDSHEVVDCAIKLPGGEDGVPVWLPIDSKFPTTSYELLLTAHELGEGIDAARKAFLSDIKREAASISSKYVRPPHTTDFAVMYLGTEGLFAEVVREPGLTQLLRNEHRIVVAGPTTLTALLGSMSMGFRTLAIQQRSSEVWQVLGKVKSEFEKSGAVWEKLEKQLATAGKTAQSAGVRHRAIARTLRGVETVEAVGGELEADGDLAIDALEEWGDVQELNESFGLDEVACSLSEDALIRQWARANGLPVGDRGRLGDDIMREYYAALEGEVA